MNKKPRRVNSEGEKLAGFKNPLIRNRSMSLEMRKCSGCERRLVGGMYQFKAGKDAALAKIWYLGKVNPSKKDDRICEICAQLGGEKDDKKVDNSYRSKEADENTAGKPRDIKVNDKEDDEDTALRQGENMKIEIERRSITPIKYELRRLSSISNNNIKVFGQFSFGETLDDMSDQEISDNDLNAGDCRIQQGEDEKKSTCFKKLFCNKGTKPYEKVGPRRYNPIWTGQDPSQIGVFIRNLRIQGVDEVNQCVDLHFYLNVVWLDPVLCEYLKKRDKICDENWFRQITITEYTELWEQVRSKGLWLKKCNEVHSHTNKLPQLLIWNTPTAGFEVRQNFISLNKGWIGKGTVSWRRLVRAKIYHSFKCRTYPFGYETVRLKLRLVQYTKQHLVLLRTNRWYKEHRKQSNQSLAGNSFSYLHPDNSLLIDWTLCSVHDGKDSWLSKFDHNDLSYRLPVYVSAGRDTQSWFEALIILKRRSRFVVFNIWIWFSLSCAVSLLTYRLNPKDDLADRLAIAVAIIFVQVQLKIHAASNTPRMPFITALDIHMWTSLLLVVVQAAIQVISAAKIKGDGFDTSLFICNSVVVVFANCSTFSLAMRRTSNQRKRIEERVEHLCNFKNGELNIDSPAPPVIKGYIKDKHLRS